MIWRGLMRTILLRPYGDLLPSILLKILLIQIFGVLWNLKGVPSLIHLHFWFLLLIFYSILLVAVLEIVVSITLILINWMYCTTSVLNKNNILFHVMSLLESLGYLKVHKPLLFLPPGVFRQCTRSTKPQRNPSWSLLHSACREKKSSF